MSIKEIRNSINNTSNPEVNEIISVDNIKKRIIELSMKQAEAQRKIDKLEEILEKKMWDKKNNIKTEELSKKEIQQLSEDIIKYNMEIERLMDLLDESCINENKQEECQDKIKEFKKKIDELINGVGEPGGGGNPPAAGSSPAPQMPKPKKKRKNVLCNDKEKQITSFSLL